MTTVIVPIGYPLREPSRETLAAAARFADDRHAELTVLHVDPYHANQHVTSADLETTTERTVGSWLPSRVHYVVRASFLVEETILEEVVAEGADVVVIGRDRIDRWRRTIRQLAADPAVEAYLREHVDCEVVTVGGRIERAPLAAMRTRATPETSREK